MPKLFSWKKKKKKREREKLPVKESLLPRPAFAAVPSTPPPADTRPSSAPPVSVGTQSEWLVVREYSLHDQRDQSSDAESDTTEPGYSSIRRDSVTRRSTRSETHLDETRQTPPSPSNRPRLATPLHSTITSPNHKASPSSPPKHEPSVSPSRSRERPLSIGELPSVSSGLSIHSDSSDDFVLNTIPSLPRERSHSDSNLQRQASDQEKELLYSKVVKPRRQRSPSAELPPKPAPYQRDKSPQAKRTRAKQAFVNNSVSESQPHERVTATLQDPNRQRGTRISYEPRVGSRGVQNPATLAVGDRYDGSSEEEEDEEMLECSEEGYLSSVEQSTSLTDLMDSPEVARRHHRSTTYPAHRPPLSTSPGKKAKEGSTPTKKHSSRVTASSPYPYRYPDSLTPPPHPHPAVKPVHLQPVSSENQMYIFSERQPDGSLQYYSATPVHSPTSPTAPTIPVMNLPKSSYYSPQPIYGLQAPVHMYSHSPKAHYAAVPTRSPGVLLSHNRPLGMTPQSAAAQLNSLQQYQQQLQRQAQQHQQSGEAILNPQVAPTQVTKVTASKSSTPIATDPSTSPAKNGAQRSSSVTEAASSGSPSTQEQSQDGHDTGAINPQKPSLSPPMRRMATDTSKPVARATVAAAADSPRVTSGRLKERESPPKCVSATAGSQTRATSLEEAKVYKEMFALMEQREGGLMSVLQSANTDLQAENAALKQLYDKLKESTDESVEVLQKQSSSLQHENTELRVQRLDREMSHTQHLQQTPLTSTGTPGEAMSSDPLAPLLKGYEERATEKDKLLRAYQEEVAQLKEEVTKLAEENERLLVENHESASERGEWLEVAEHARSLLQENTALLKQQELQRERMREMKREHQARVSPLGNEIVRLKKEREALERDLRALRENHTHLQWAFQQLTRQSAKHITVEEHQQALEEVQSLLEDLSEKTESDAKTQDAQIRVMLKENRLMATKLADAKAIILQLEEECTALHKANRKAQEKIAELQYELEASRDREVAVHDQLNKAVVQAEKALAERDAFSRIAKSQQRTRDRATAQRSRNEFAISKLQQTLEAYKHQASEKLNRASVLLQEQEREGKGQRRHYERELKHLQSLLRKKQNDFDALAKEKRSVDNELGLLWRSRARDTTSTSHLTPTSKHGH